jgi:hypothetical protein
MDEPVNGRDRTKLENLMRGPAPYCLDLEIASLTEMVDRERVFDLNQRLERLGYGPGRLKLVRRHRDETALREHARDEAEIDRLLRLGKAEAARATRQPDGLLIRPNSGHILGVR